jgi:hypothetical protein
MKKQRVTKRKIDRGKQRDERYRYMERWRDTKR